MLKSSGYISTIFEKSFSWGQMTCLPIYGNNKLLYTVSMQTSQRPKTCKHIDEWACDPLKDLKHC